MRPWDSARILRKVLSPLVVGVHSHKEHTLTCFVLIPARKAFHVSFTRIITQPSLSLLFFICMSFLIEGHYTTEASLTKAFARRSGNSDA